MDAAKRGADALSAGRYSDAINEYTAAINVSATSPDYHIKRSMAYQRSSPADYANALSDAEKAVLFAQQRAKRELIIQAQLRRAIALFGLERYADAKFVIDVVKKMDPKEKTLPIWENKIAAKMAALAADDAKNQVTVKKTPDISKLQPAANVDNHGASSNKGAPPTSAKPPSAPVAPAQTPADKIRHDWYQNSESVTFTLLAKGVPEDKAVIDIQPSSLTISFPLANDSEYHFSLDPLYAPIDASASAYNIMSTKVEIILKKAQPGQKWHALESDESTSASETPALAIPTDVLKAPSQAGPAYPTSSRNGPKNWDKLANELTTTKQKTKDVDKTVITEDDDDYDYDKAENGDDVNNFFQKLYAGADPDTRRAMMKSFSESNGTALSTNWGEVGKKKMETTPPDGMEAKQW